MTDPGDETFRVLLVCRANVCRSPLAARLLADRLGASGSPFLVTSAGVAAIPTVEMCPVAQAALSNAGVAELGPHVPRMLDPDDLAGADLVLGADTEICHELLRTDPLSRPRTFTFREAAPIAALAHEQSAAGATGVPALRALVGRMADARPAVWAGPEGVPPPRPWWRRHAAADGSPWDVTDAHLGARARLHNGVTRQVVDAIEALAEVLARASAGASTR